MTTLQTATCTLAIVSTPLAAVTYTLVLVLTPLAVVTNSESPHRFPSPFAKRTNQPCNPNFAKKLVNLPFALAIFQIAKRQHSVSVRHINHLLVTVRFCQLFFQIVQGAQVITAPLPNTCRRISICKYCPYGKVIYFSLQMRSNICIFI